MSYTVLITGASRGIGAAIAKEFASHGCNLILTCAHSMEDLKAIASHLKETYKISCDPYQVDGSDYQAVEQLFEKITSPDILINNAGIAFFGLLSDMTPNEWHKVLSTNLDSCFYTCKLAIPHMVHQKMGRIINISSVWGNVGSSMEVAYSTSKGGINAFTKALAKELAPSSIPVNAIACGMIDTHMNACLSSDDLDALREEIPCDRLGQPLEVAKLAWQLANSPAYMTGQIITIDGGWI